MNEAVLWYISRIEYYYSLILINSNKKENSRFRLYGDLEEYTNLKGIEFMHNFWIRGLNHFMNEEVERKVKAETSKLKQKLEGKENKIIELVELTR